MKLFPRTTWVANDVMTPNYEEKKIFEGTPQFHMKFCCMIDSQYFACVVNPLVVTLMGIILFSYVVVIVLVQRKVRNFSCSIPFPNSFRLTKGVFWFTELNWLEPNWTKLIGAKLNWVEMNYLWEKEVRNWIKLNWLELNWTEIKMKRTSPNKQKKCY